jgi:hypothetical protein
MNKQAQSSAFCSREEADIKTVGLVNKIVDDTKLRIEC